MEFWGNSYTGNALWTPATLSSAFWFDASDDNSLVYSSNTVSQWSDKSGNNRNLLQGTIAQRPAVSADLNGKNVLLFDGISKWMVTSSMSGLSVANSSFFYVAKFPSHTSYGLPVSLGINQANNARTYGNLTGTSMYYATFGNDIATTISSDLDGSYHVHGARQNGRTITAARDGTSSTFTLPSNIATINPAYFAIGTIASSTGTAISAYWAKINMAEIVVFANAVDDATTAKVEGYLAWKWGITASLASGHAYKSAPPVI